MIYVVTHCNVNDQGTWSLLIQTQKTKQWLLKYNNSNRSFFSETKAALRKIKKRRSRERSKISFEKSHIIFETTKEHFRDLIKS